MGVGFSIFLTCLAFAQPVLIEPFLPKKGEIAEFKKNACSASKALARADQLCPWVAEATYLATHQLPHDQSRHGAAVDGPTKELVQNTDATEGAFCAMGTLHQTVETASTAAKSSASIQLKNLTNAKGYLKEWKESLVKSSKLEPRMECFAKCGSGSPCEKKCQLSGKDRLFWQLDVDVVPEKVASHRPPLKSIFEASAKEQSQLAQKVEDLGKAYSVWEKQLVSAESVSRNARKKLAEKYKCEELRQKAALNAEKASRSINVVENGLKGSGFYVETTGADGKPQYHFVTAQHVAGDTSSGSPSKLESNTLDAPDADGKMGVYRAPIEPGSYDRGNDVVSQPARKKEGALKVVSANDTPEVGQEFQVSGHPGYSSLEYQSHTCTFEGYIPAYRQDGTAYLMRCPSAANTVVSGISGGPVTDHTGKVWGVNSAQFTRENSRYMIVAPISAKEGGGVQYGLQRTFVTENCIDKFGARRRCQIIPGYTNSTQGP